MADPKQPNDPDPYVDNIPHNPGEPVPPPEKEAPTGRKARSPEEQSDG